MDFANQNILLVSGTSKSGRVVAKTVAKEGGTVAFTYHVDEDKAGTLLESLDGDEHEAWQCDVTDWESVERVVGEAFAHLGTVDGLVYTVGQPFHTGSEIGQADVDFWQRVIAVNTTGAFHTLKAAADGFADQDGGAIVAVSASEGMMREPGFTAFDASKTGLEAVVLEVARELGPHGVRANVVAPGYIRDPTKLSEEAKDEFVKQTPLKRICTDQDVANLALFLCSDYAAQVTGAVVPVDGGMAIAPPMDRQELSHLEFD